MVNYQFLFIVGISLSFNSWASDPDAELIRHLDSNPYIIGLSVGDISVAEWNNLYRVYPNELKDEVIANPDRKEEIARKRYGFIAGPLSPMPIGFTRLQSGKYRVNCLLCHSGLIPGKDGPVFKVGAPNRFVNVNDYFLDRIALAKKFPRYSSAKSLVDKAVFSAYRKILKGFKLNSNRGTTAVWKYAAMILATRNNRARYDIRSLLRFARGKAEDYSTGVVDIDVPAWWNTGLKTRLFSDSSIENSSRLYSLFIAGPPNNLRKLQPALSELHNLISAVPAPRYPFPVDSARSTRGAKLFERKCTGCHGSYLADGSVAWPEKTIELDKVQTDPSRATVGMTPAYRSKILNSWIGSYGTADVRVEIDGYVAPPLRGVWATAPYLHNGSIPTLSDFLEITPRPNFWREISGQFDWQKNGWKVSSYASKPNDLKSWEEVDLFDTTQFGKSNAGHPFHRSLSIEERRDVLEYLKTL